MSKVLPLVQIYRWADGSVAYFHRFEDELDGSVEKKILIESATSSWKHPETEELTSVFELIIGKESGSFLDANLGFPDIPEEVEKKVRGLFLDLGIEVWGVHTGIVSGNWVQYPRWVDDETWDRRYELAKEFLTPEGAVGPLVEERSFMGVPGFFINRGWVDLDESDRYNCGAPAVFKLGRKQGFTAFWLRTSWMKALTLEALVDTFLEQKFLVLPESRRASWEAEHVERGTNVLPTREEIELYQMLGEPNPLLWPVDRLVAWFEEQVGRQ